MKKYMLMLALAAAGVASATGTLTVKFGSAMEVIEGGVTNTYAQNATFTPTAIPCIYMMRPANMAEGERTFGIKGTEDIRAGDVFWRFPQYGDGNWVRVALDPYPAEDTTVTLTGYKTPNFFYADAEHGNDDWDGSTATIPTQEVIDSGGTIPGPKKSLQAAHDAATGTRPIIFAAPGVYNTGVATNYSSETSNPCIRRLISTKANIGYIATEGAEKTFIVGAPDTAGTDGKYGDESVGGVYMGGHSAGNVQFMQGFTITGCYSPGTQSGANQYGTGFCSGASRAYCLDCVISNNYAVSIAPATHYGVIERTRITENESKQYTTRTGVFVSCVFAGNRLTIIDTTAATRALHQKGNTYFCTYDLRSAIQTSGRKRVECEDSFLRAGLVYCLTEKSETTTNATRWLSKSQAIDDPLFADADARDYRLKKNSTARNVVSYADDLDARARMLMTGDIDGRLPVLNDGKLNIGAYWNGPTIWYVAQNGGSDANDGLSPATAKATINAAIALSFSGSGDTVRVGPGTYGEAEGDRRTSDADTAGFRVIVPEDVTLESTDGAEKTFIVGAEAPVEDTDNETWGTGANGIRCVYGRDGATVRGFTLTGGRGVGVNSGSNTGAAFYSATARGATVEDCIISNNAAYRYIINQAVVNRCRVMGNVSTCTSWSGSAGYLCSYYNTIFDNNIGEGMIHSPVVMQNCTIGSGNKLNNGDDVRVIYKGTGKVEVYNTLVLGGRAYGGSAGYDHIALSNCLVRSDNTTWTGIPETNRYNTVINSSLQVSVDGEYRPTFGEFVGIDRRGAIYSDAIGDKDAYGNPRIMNGEIDVGAVEYDWRPKFAQEVGKKLAITDVSPSVTTNAVGGLLIPSGAVAGTVADGGKYSFTFELSGGSLEAFVGGESSGVYSEAGEQTIDLTIPDSATEFRLVFTPDAENPGSAVLKKIASDRGLVIILM